MSKRDNIVRELGAAHAGEETLYTGCHLNCGGGACVLKVRRKNGVITAVEPDDHYNRGVGREDEVVSDDDLGKMRLQLRACPMAWAWHKFTYSPDRVLYPMKRVEGAKRGQGEFQRISWEEALDLVAGKMKEFVANYGPYSVLLPYAPGHGADRFFCLWEAGADGWGTCSMDGGRLGIHLMAGILGTSYEEGSNGVADILLHTKLIVLWGFEPTTNHKFGGGHMGAYFIKMARERGIPVICIDPRYTVAAEVLADQWIPIKPGTDAAMMLAVANVVIREDLYNKEYVDKYVDEEGFVRWRAYILGEDDGVEKTPEWAEEICGVPAETIRSFAHLYAQSKPTWLWKGWAVQRKGGGENVARAALALQAIMGYWGVPGGSVPWEAGNRNLDVPPKMLPYGDLPTKRTPTMFRAHKWAQAILLLDKVHAGEMSVEEYRRIIGWRAPTNLPLPNPKMIIRGGAPTAAGSGTGTSTLNNTVDSTNELIKALERLEFVVWMQTRWTPITRYADVVLPVLEETFEEHRIAGTWHGHGGLSNFTYIGGVSEPVGEARSGHWVETELARRLGFGEQFNRFYKGTSWEDWWEAWDQYLSGEYGRATAQVEAKTGHAQPSFEEFKKAGLINLEECFDQPYVGYQNFIQRGEPLKTISGKIEIWSYVIADESRRGKFQIDHLRRPYGHLPNDWRGMSPIPIYQSAYRGIDHHDVRQLPLMLLTPFSRYRSHSTLWDVPWIRGDCYRHGCWINVADARPRGIKSGDLVKVFNDKGVLVIPAYVTARILPGVVAIHHGGWYQPDEEGVDWGCTPNVLLGDPESPPISSPVTTLVEMEKYDGPRKQTSWLAMDQPGSSSVVGAGSKPARGRAGLKPAPTRSDARKGA